LLKGFIHIIENNINSEGLCYSMPLFFFRVIKLLTNMLKAGLFMTILVPNGFQFTFARALAILLLK